MTETGKRIKTLLNNEIRPSVLMYIECLADWYKISQTIYLQTEILENDLLDQEEGLRKIRSKLFILREDIKTHIHEKNNYPQQANEHIQEKHHHKDFETFSRLDLQTLYSTSCDNKTLVRENKDLISHLISLIDTKGLV